MMTPEEKKRAKEHAQLEYLRQHCCFTFENGRQCTMLRNQFHHLFCTFHAQREAQDNDNAQFGHSIIGPEETLDSAETVNTVLTRILRLAATSRITPRHAAVMAYLGQLIVNTLPHIRKEDELRLSVETSGVKPLDIGLLENLQKQIARLQDRQAPSVPSAHNPGCDPKEKAKAAAAAANPPSADAAPAPPAAD